MKIGILTFHRPCNFGANLQAYCSCQYFASLGCEVKVIDYVRDADESYSNSIPRIQYEKHMQFICKNLPLTKTARNEKEMQEVVRGESFDLIVIGADAVWRCPKDNDIFFAKWLFEDEQLKHIPVVSLSAAHMGNGFQSLSEQERGAIKEYIEGFSYITVRDDWTKTVVNRDLFSGKEVIKILNPDPVMMLNFFCKQNWGNQGQKSKGYYLMSLSTNWANGRTGWLKCKWFNSFKSLVNKAGYQLVELPLPEGASGMPFDYTIPYPIDPLQWYLWLKNAKAYCGQRFHSIVSCISSGTPFFSIDVYGRSSSKKLFYNLMGLYGKARQGDDNSKIDFLLKGSGFEKNRVDVFIETIKPSYLFNMLEGMDALNILQFRDSKIEEFRYNIKTMFELIKSE